MTRAKTKIRRSATYGKPEKHAWLVFVRLYDSIGTVVGQIEHMVPIDSNVDNPSATIALLKMWPAKKTTKMARPRKARKRSARK